MATWNRRRLYSAHPPLFPLLLENLFHGEGGDVRKERKLSITAMNLSILEIVRDTLYNNSFLLRPGTFFLDRKEIESDGIVKGTISILNSRFLNKMSLSREFEQFNKNV